MCGTPYLQSIGFVLADGEARAIYYASLHHHDGQHDAWVDVTLGTWPALDEDPWRVVDFVVLQDPHVRDHLDHQPVAHN